MSEWQTGSTASRATQVQVWAEALYEADRVEQPLIDCTCVPCRTLDLSQKVTEESALANSPPSHARFKRVLLPSSTKVFSSYYHQTTE